MFEQMDHDFQNDRLGEAIRMADYSAQAVHEAEYRTSVALSSIAISLSLLANSVINGNLPVSVTQSPDADMFHHVEQPSVSNLDAILGAINEQHRSKRNSNPTE